MDILFSQKLEYSTIIPYKNYSNIRDKVTVVPIDIETSGLSSNPPDDEIFKDIFAQPELKQVNRRNDRDFYLDTPKKKRGKYFYAGTADADIEERVQIPLDSAFRNDRVCFSTTNERHLKQNYGNPFASIVIHKIERSIVRRDNKITFKLYQRTKRREVNWRFFKQSVSIYSLTVNTDTGNFTVTEIQNSKETRWKKFRRNYFSGLLELVNHNGLFGVSDDYHDKEIKKEYNQTFDNIAFFDAVDTTLGFHSVVNDDSIDGNGLSLYEMKILRKKQFIDNFVYYFAQKKKIKTPNNFKELLIYYYPTEKYFKKNKRKLVASILDKYGIKSGGTIKLLHTNPNIDIITLVKLCMVLGKNHSKYIGNINPANFDRTSFPIYSIDYNVLSQIQAFKPTEFTNYELSDIERENVVSIINSVLTDRKITSPVPIKTLYGSLLDHFSMINEIKPYVPGIYLNARNYTDFNKEHLDYSKILALIKKPFVIEYVFDEETVEEIEKRIPIIPFEKDYTDEDYLYPVLLKREEEYVEEGSHMHHCVAGYADKERSIIISLRTHDNEDRVTSEFDIRSGSCLQSRHFHNGSVPQMFEYALTTVKNRVNALAKKDKLNWKEKNKVRVVINGIEIADPKLVPQNLPMPDPQDHPPIFEDVDVAW